MTEQKNKLFDAAHEFDLPICLRDECEFHRDYVLLKWSDGTTTRITIKPEPILIEDGMKIKLNYSLVTTRAKVI